MKYYLITGWQKGVKVIEFNNKDFLLEYIDSYYSDGITEFMHSPNNDDYFKCGDYMIIKGSVLLPRGVEIIKKYDID